MILCLLGFIGYTIFQRANILYWGRRTLFVLVFGLVICCFAAARDGLDKTIQHTIDGSCAPGIFPLLSIPNLIGCIGAAIIIIAAIATPIAKSQAAREVWFYFMCDGGIVRNLDVKAHGHNNDGIDLEMSRNFLIENCVFDQGDDAVVIKAGRNQDAWRLNTPCENIVIRHCDILKGHTLLGIGSEMSGGVRNVYMHNCTAPDSVFRLFFAKTNHRRGGFIENIWMKNVKAGKMQRVLEVDTDVLYQWRDLVPTYQDSITFINGLYMDSVTCDRTEAVYDLKGDARLPIKNVEIRNVTVGEVTKFVKNVVNAENVVEENIIYKEKQDKQ